MNVSGEAKTKNGDPRPGVGIQLRDRTGRVIHESTTAENGKYLFLIEDAGLIAEGSPFYVTIDPETVEESATPEQNDEIARWLKFAAISEHVGDAPHPLEVMEDIQERIEDGSFEVGTISVPVEAQPLVEPLPAYLDPSKAAQLFQGPHCDLDILHAPGECRFCDAFPEAQEQRDQDGINYSGHNDPDKAPCPGLERRTYELSQGWPGNTPEGYSLVDGFGYQPNENYTALAEQFKDTTFYGSVDLVLQPKPSMWTRIKRAFGGK